MENAVITQPQKSFMTVQDMKTQVSIIQQMLKQVMTNGVHYGTIQGCGDKPTLLKAGAEKIMMTFRLACDPIVDDLSTADEIRYRVKTNLTAKDRSFVGSGIGECSSSEEKYMWRSAICDEEFEATPENRKREKFKNGKNGFYKVRQVRTNISDVANTILKMAKKRSLVDAVLTATGASDCFQQDVEDLPEEIREEIQGSPVAEKTPPKMPESKSAQQPQEQQKQDQQNPKPEGKLISDKQGKRLIAIAKENGHTVDDIKEFILFNYNLERPSHITVDIYDAIVDHFSIKKGA